MNEDTIADFKQFIAATISQQTSDLTSRLDGIDGRLDKIEATMTTKADLEHTKDEILEAIGDTMSTNTEATDTQLAGHEQRLITLESKTA